MALPTFDDEGESACEVIVLHAPTDVLLPLARRRGLHALLSEAERERHARFRFERDRDTYLVAHGVLRLALARLSGLAPELITFEQGEHGKPRLADPGAAGALDFNLSHTRGRIAWAFTRGAAVGVDVEETGREVDLLSVGERVYSPAELAGLRALSGPAQRARFFELWTLKESYIKAIGKGFAAPLQSITFAPEHADPVPLVLAADIDDDASRYCVRRLPGGSAHALAVVWRGRDPNALRVVELSATSLA